LLINVALSNFYTLYPVGRKIFIKCKGLYIGYVKGVVQLGILDNSGTQPALGQLPQSLVDQFIFRGVWNQAITPKVVTIANVMSYNAAYENELITISAAEFTTADSGKPYANAPLQNSLARYIQDCSGNQVEIYTSGYATFASTLTPGGGGSITAIYMAYNTTPELILRELSDVHMTGPRLGGGAAIGTGGLMNIIDVRGLFSACGAIFASGTKIHGTVISDLTTGNITGNNLVMQDETGGIVIRFTSANTFNIGDSIEVNLSGDSLVAFHNLVQANYVANSAATLLASGRTVTPRVATLAQVIANQSIWESTMLKINNVTLTGGGTYGSNSGNVTMNDGTSVMELFTRTAANFAGTSYPTTPVSVTGYLSTYNGTPELNIRSASDVQ